MTVPVRKADPLKVRLFRFRARPSGDRAGRPASFRGSRSVSYTHLDVYKRQLGAGSPQHLSIEYMKQRFGFDMTHVPYRSTPQSITDIVANHVQLGFVEAGASLPLIRLSLIHI